MTVFLDNSSVKVACRKPYTTERQNKQGTEGLGRHTHITPIPGYVTNRKLVSSLTKDTAKALDF